MGTVSVACLNARPSPLDDVTSISVLAGLPRQGTVSVVVCTAARCLSRMTLQGAVVLGLCVTSGALQPLPVSSPHRT